jgi:hypothetical protein
MYRSLPLWSIDVSKYFSSEFISFPGLSFHHLQMQYKYLLDKAQQTGISLLKAVNSVVDISNQ